LRRGPHAGVATKENLPSARPPVQCRGDPAGHPAASRRGDLYISSRLSSKLLERLIETTKPPRGGRPREDEQLRIEGLDEDDYQVFLLIGLGKKVREIAEELHSSRESVEHSLRRLKQSLQLEDDFELLRCASHWVRERCQKT